MNIPLSLSEQQQAFVTWLRSGQSAPALSHIKASRLEVYRELFFNNMESLLANGFPVIRKILGEESWRLLVKTFWLQHRCQTPYFPQVGAEFVHWLQQTSPATAPPFLRELAHYEWMEVVVDTAEITVPELPVGVAALRPDSLLLFNPVSVLLHYDYPVQRIGVNFQPPQIPLEKTRLLVYRNRQHQVKFMALSAASMLLLDVLQTQSRSLLELVAVAEQSLQATAGTLQDLVKQQVEDWIGREVIFIQPTHTG